MSSPITPLEQADAMAKAFLAALENVRAKASEFQILAESQRRRYNRARAAAVILGVITPTFVSYQTQHTGRPGVAVVLGILAILFTASAGIVAGLQTTFRWGEGFGRATTASLELQELATKQDLETMVIRGSSDLMTRHTTLKEHLNETLSQMRLIVRKFNEGELANIKEAEQPKPGTSQGTAKTPLGPA